MIDAYLLAGGLMEIEMGLEGPAANRTADLVVFVAGRPAASELVGRWQMTSAVHLVGSRCAASCETPATADSDFSLTINSGAVATITFPAGQTVGVVHLLVDSMPAGTLRLRAPNPRDPTLSDVSITISGDR